MRQRLDKLDDRQCRQVLYFLYGAYKYREDVAANEFLRQLRDGIEWMERGKRKENENGRGCENSGEVFTQAD